MSARAPKPRYERQVASDRQEALIEAAIDSLKRHGHEGLSVRRIAAEAGVSIGLINHHFPNKDTLIAESYRTFSRRLSDLFGSFGIDAFCFQFDLLFRFPEDGFGACGEQFLFAREFQFVGDEFVLNRFPNLLRDMNVTDETVQQCQPFVFQDLMK